ncbi:hypothetical protein DPMN_136151 [Dreissena polymorpha]|uniref:Uncharacterized protein n=1 Tax=Dreissena polymorpha TaxID=45954 RepID=A0A9D4FZF8_DREPO|nr:hypothetical protein DPMN_136151 [Dreissena polymorpha]
MWPLVKYAPPPGGHVSQQKGIISELVQDIIGMNLLTKFHEDWTINVAFRVQISHVFQAKTINLASRVLTSGHVFKATKTIFKLIQDIIGTNLLTKFHDDRKINVTSGVFKKKHAPPPMWSYIIGINLLTKFHEDQTIIVASRVLTRFYYSHIRKNAPPLGSHDFQANVTIFELIHDIN